MDALSDGFQPLSMFVDPNEWDEKGCGSIHSRATSVTAVSVGPTVSESFQLEDADAARTFATRAFNNLSALLNNPDSRYLMGLNGVPYRSIPGVPKSSTTEREDDYPNLILESSVVKIQNYLLEEIEHNAHPSVDDLDPLYFIPVVNWLFLRLQNDRLLTDGRVCQLCQSSRIQKFIDGALVQIILAVALIVFTPWKISAVIVAWNAVCILLEEARSSLLLGARALSAKEETFLKRMRQSTRI